MTEKTENRKQWFEVTMAKKFSKLNGRHQITNQEPQRTPSRQMLKQKLTSDQV
jgi:hypothetical protein